MCESGRPEAGRERETLELVRAYYRIPDPDLRNELLALIKRLAGRAGRPIRAGPAASVKRLG
jgi:hypothetical protein